MPAHEALIDLYEALNYQQDLEGLCYGFAIRWLEASLLSEEEQQRFENRIQLIEFTPLNMLLKQIAEAKAKKGKNLTQSDKENLEILSFYDSLELFHNLSKWFFLVNETRQSQERCENISIIASSEAIKERGGLKRLYSAPFIFTKEELENYLNQLGQQLEPLSIFSNAPIGFLLTSDVHTVALIYKPGQGWTYRDSNRDAPMRDSTKSIAEAILKDMQIAGESPYVAFNANLILTASDPRCTPLEEKLAQFKPLYTVTDDIARRKTNTVNLVYIAAQNNHIDDIESLARHGADLNQEDEVGTTPVYIAAQNGHAETIKILGRYGANLDQKTHYGVTAAYIAAQHGDKETQNILKAIIEVFTPST
ncbi:ankyrin repeat domain-containing protein [Legionella sp. CNM-1927-20]|uniref:ankyrin repeat domain-containing protein n=1 Tax=Legionella sp. CNM-1927-20 TaxID=3422221 RepID=UPI00403AB4EB